MSVLDWRGLRKQSSFTLHATFLAGIEYIEKQEINMQHVNQPLSKVLVQVLLLTITGTLAVPASAEIFEYPIANDAEEVEIDEGIEFTLTCIRARTGDENDSGIIRITASDEDAFDLDLSSSEISLSRNSSFSSWFNVSKTVSAELLLSYSPEAIEVRSAAEGRVSECFSDSAHVELTASSGSSLRINGGNSQITQLEVDVSSGAKIDIKAPMNMTSAKVEASSGGQIEFADEVEIDSASVRISSGGSAEMCGAKAIDGRISSGGNIDVSESAKRTDLKISSGGNVDSFHC